MIYKVTYYFKNHDKKVLFLKSKSIFRDFVKSEQDALMSAVAGNTWHIVGQDQRFYFLAKELIGVSYKEFTKRPEVKIIEERLNTFDTITHKNEPINSNTVIRN